MGERYLPWPGDADERILVSVYDNCNPVSSHMHDFIEIVFIAKGSCIHRYRGGEAVLIPGDVFVIAPHEPHSYDIGAQTAIYNCLFYPDALTADWDSLQSSDGIGSLLAAEEQPGKGVQTILHLGPAEASELETALDKLLDEQQARRRGFRLAQKAHLLMVLTALGRALDEQSAGAAAGSAGNRDKLASVLSHIESSYAADLTVGELAAAVYLSPGYFRKVFKEITGLSPADYICNVRISKAARLLNDSSLPVARIAEAVGIGDLNYFSRLFRQKLGCSPSEYRKTSAGC